MITIYMLVDPRGFNYAYVGATNRPDKRLKEHTNDITGYPRNRKCLWLKELKKEGLSPTFVVLDVCSEKDAYLAEEDAIAMVRAQRGSNLLNKIIHRKLKRGKR